MEEESLTHFPVDFSDLDSSFTSSTSSYATTFASNSSARSSLSLSLPSFSSSSTIRPLPHSRSHPLWSSLRAATALSPDGFLHLRHLHLLRPLGSGDLARVFHCRLRDNPNSDFALKVVDLDASSSSSSSKDRLAHVRAEAHALASLDHPFLPTLYARLDASHYSCFLIDYCPGGDLHSLLRRLPRHRLPLPTVRFYAAEVLLALEYLHALGFIYRDLKPENVLLRADGHVMLSDFDLCFQSEVVPALLRHRKPRHSPSSKSSSCLRGSSSGDEEEELEFVAEPDTAFSRACVGTHEYLAPEVVNGSGHGSGVDWWALGIFIYELLYGRTPFKGNTKEATLRNIVTKEVRFPEAGNGVNDVAARDLITRLLVKDPRRRMGCTKGAAEIKSHPFFRSVKWALLRSCKAPHCAGREKREEKRSSWRCMERFNRLMGTVRLGLKGHKKKRKEERLL